MYTATTRDIRVDVEPHYLEEQSDPTRMHHVWAYHVVIENQGTETVQLLNRYWHITDETGHVQEVSGPGVVGSQPVLAPGERFDYTSGCPLNAPSGVMMGRYEMVNQAGDRFEIDIPAFSLDLPESRPLVH